jgi:hypothetical protein
MIVELARHGSSCGWVALCERRRARFARLSGWQPVGNWVASGANFPASLLPVGVTPTPSRESRRAVCAEKWPEAQAERVAGVHVFSSQEGRNHPPRLGSFFCRAVRRAGPDRLRDALIAWAQGEKIAGFLFVVATCAAAALIAAWLVRRFSPHASGSGIPHVEAVLNEQIPQAPFRNSTRRGGWRNSARVAVSGI